MGFGTESNECGGKEEAVGERDHGNQSSISLRTTSRNVIILILILTLSVLGDRLKIVQDTRLIPDRLNVNL